jgi:membrane-bound lytic murein transglycosylase D
MKFIFVFVLIFNSLQIVSANRVLVSLDSSRNKIKPSIPRKAEREVLDTLNSNYLNEVYDNSLVLAKDFPMPVDENSLFENDLYKKRLDSLQKNIPLTYNEYVQSYINLYVYKRRALIERLLGEGTYYFPIFDRALKEEGVPSELKYLPIIESALNPFAISRVGATGPWQFMPGTGRDYGLKINSNRDERRDPYLSSKAAAKYLRDMYDRYGDWLLVIASYNCGKGNVDKAIRKSGGEKNFWVIQRFLPKETRTYVPAFIAATYAMNYAPHHGLHLQFPAFNIHPDTVPILQTVSLSSVADNLCISPEEIRYLNPQFKSGIIFGTAEAPSFLLVPGGNLSAVIELKNSLKLDSMHFTQLNSAYPVDGGHHSFISRLIHHRVRPGETLLIIADRYSCKVSEIKSWNHLHTIRIKPGQNLRVKQNLEFITKINRIHFSPHLLHYKVRKGDTLKIIASRYHISVNSLRGLNGLHSNLVKTGQNLKVSNRI